MKSSTPSCFSKRLSAALAAATDMPSLQEATVMLPACAICTNSSKSFTLMALPSLAVDSSVYRPNSGNDN